MANLVKSADETGYRARADRSIQSGRVVSVNKTSGTAVLDVGMVDQNGAHVYLIDVPFSPQTPPQPQDIVTILRTNSSPYSMLIGGGAAVGGANSGGVVETGGGVTSLAKPAGTEVQGNVLLAEGTDITITRSGQTFTFSLADCTDTSSIYGVFADLCARLDNIEALVAITAGTGSFYSYDFSKSYNSMYAAIGVW